MRSPHLTDKATPTWQTPSAATSAAAPSSAPKSAPLSSSKVTQELFYGSGGGGNAASSSRSPGQSAMLGRLSSPLTPVALGFGTPGGGAGGGAGGASSPGLNRSVWYHLLLFDLRFVFCFFFKRIHSFLVGKRDASAHSVSVAQPIAIEPVWRGSIRCARCVEFVGGGGEN